MHLSFCSWLFCTLSWWRLIMYQNKQTYRKGVQVEKSGDLTHSSWFSVGSWGSLCRTLTKCNTYKIYSSNFVHVLCTGPVDGFHCLQNDHKPIACKLRFQDSWDELALFRNTVAGVNKIIGDCSVRLPTAPPNMPQCRIYLRESGW